MKNLFKHHDNDLSVIKNNYDELKSSIEKVKSRQLSDPVTGQPIEDHQLEDLHKLEVLIKQLAERWNNSMHIFKAR